jgi:hypothetical protein
MASSLSLKEPSGLPHNVLRTHRQLCTRSGTHQANLHLATGFARSESRLDNTYKHATAVINPIV